MPSFVRALVAAIALFGLASTPALAVLKVEGRSAIFAWEPATGPVDHYAVHVARSGEKFKYRIEARVSQPMASVSGQYEEKLKVRVTACTESGSCSKPSKDSTKIQFVDPNATSSKDAKKAEKAAAKAAKQAEKAAAKAAKQAEKAAAKAAKQAEKAAKKAAKQAAKNAGSADVDGWNGAYGPDQPAPAPAAASAQGADPYDFNRDGRTDLLWYHPKTRGVALWLMSGLGPYRIVHLGELEKGWEFVGSGDFDRDGRADLLLEGRGEYEIWLMNNAAVRRAVALAGPGRPYKIEAIGDFDGDGYSDLLWVGGKQTLVWFMRGTSLDEEVAGPSIKKLKGVACTPDLDGDGRSDLIWHAGKESIAWLMDGASPWRSGPAGPGMGKSRALGCGDADGDGFGDVVWSGRGSQQGRLWAMDGDIGVDLELELPELESRWAVEASGDYDGDGLANELMLRDASGERVEFWRLRWNGSRTDYSVFVGRSVGLGDKSWQAIVP